MSSDAHAPSPALSPASMAVRPRIAVLRALPGLGDLLCAVPALRAIRAAHPAAHVTLVGLPAAGWFAQRYPGLVDDLLVVDGVAGLPEVAADAARALDFYRRAQERRLDLALQLHGSGTTSNPLLTMLGAHHQVSAHRPGEWVPPGTSVAYPEDEPEIARLLAVTTAAACPPRGDDIDLPVRDGETAVARALLAEAGLAPGTFVCLHPGASRPERRWPPARFAATADHLALRGVPLVLTGSPGERALVQEVVGRMTARPDRVVDLAGRTSIGVLGALYRRARLVLTNDTGASHVAAAVRAPSVVVFGSAEPDRWAPLDAERHRRVAGRPPDWPPLRHVTEAVDDQLHRFDGDGGDGDGGDGRRGGAGVWPA
jgi:ADP-heptose:LPS heptosyltransferase